MDKDGGPLAGARIIVGDRTKKIRTQKDGDFWRLLVPGTYNIRVAKRGYLNARKTVTVYPEMSTFVNFTLVKKPARVKDQGAANVRSRLRAPGKVTFHPAQGNRGKLRLSVSSKDGKKSTGHMVGPALLLISSAFVVVSLLLQLH